MTSVHSVLVDVLYVVASFLRNDAIYQYIMLLWIWTPLANLDPSRYIFVIATYRILNIVLKAF
jgi:hypothetical protein